MKKRITIKDIAQKLNVHHSTVSRALRDDCRINPDTRKQIMDYAKSAGYQANMNAIQLRGGGRNVLAVLVPNINHQFFSNVISHFASLANKNNYVVSIFQSNENLNQEKKIIDTIIQNNIAGVIVSVSMETNDCQHFNKLKKFNIPLVFFDRVCDKTNVPKVVINNFEIMDEAVALLARKGYKRIAHISGPPSLNVFRERQKGYIQAIKTNNLSYQSIVTINTKFTVSEGLAAANKLFSRNPNPDAIICDSHYLFHGVTMRLNKMKLSMPDDIGIITFGENPLLDFINPGITAILQPYEEVSNKAFELLNKEITGNHGNIVESCMLSAKIIERRSC